MLRVDPSLNHIPARREHVVSLYESINQPLVNIPNHGTAPTGAYLLGTRNEHGYYTVFVYLHQPDTRAVIIYVSEPRSLTGEQFRVEESEAVRFVESMGFMADTLHFRQLTPAEQDAVMQRVPIFRPPVSTLELYDVAEELGARGNDPFGSIGAAGSEVFRRAGLTPGPQQGLGGHQVFGGVSASMAQPLGGVSGSMAAQHFGPPTPTHGGRLLGHDLQVQGLTLPTALGAPVSPGSGAYPAQLGVPTSPPQPAPPLRAEPTARPEPPDAEALQRLGRLLAAFGVLAALSIGASACKTPSDAEIPVGADPIRSQLDVGDQQLAERKYAEAIATYRTVLAEQPKDRDALRGTGLAYLGLDRLEDAEKFYRQAVDADPKWSEPKNELASILMRTNRCEEAEKLLRAVTEDIFYSTPEFGRHNLALALQCEGKSAEAIQVLQTLVTEKPHFCLGYLTLSQISLQARQFEHAVKACEDFDQQCAKDEKIKEHVTPEHSATCYLRSGMAYAQMGDVESARVSFLRCRQTNAATIGKECQSALDMLPP